MIITENPVYITKKVKNRVAVIGVKNIQKAYWDFIDYYRSLFKIPVIGVTGTCGKTTTTDMLKKILSTKYITEATKDGRNGLCENLSYLLGFDESTEAAVFELGVTSLGCIKESCRYFKPEVGILLNIGVYHLDGCKTHENYIKAKAELLEGMGNRGKLIVNADDENIKKIDFSKFKGEIIKIGVNGIGDYQARNITLTEKGIIFELLYQNSVYPVFIPGFGKHNVYNALAALAASQAVGVKLEEAIEGLATFKYMRKHLQFYQGLNGSTIIDDTWNCNPPGIEAALQVLRDMAKGRKKIAVIGYMPLLGEEGQEEYLKIGEKVVKAGVDLLVTLGEEPKAIGSRALELGMNNACIYSCTKVADVEKLLQSALDKNSLVLFKFPYRASLRRHPSYPLFKACMNFIR